MRGPQGALLLILLLSEMAVSFTCCREDSGRLTARSKGGEFHALLQVERPSRRALPPHWRLPKVPVPHKTNAGCLVVMRSTAKSNRKYSGRSDQRVPSLAKTAMRSTGGTKSAVPSVVTRRTKFVIADFARPSFHERSGSRAHQ